MRNGFVAPALLLAWVACVAGGIMLSGWQIGAQVPVGPPTIAAGNLARTVWRGVYTVQQAERGERTYKAYCGVCHGIEARLSTQPVFVGAPFMTRWRDQSVGDVFMTIKVNMPRENPASLTDEEYIDIVTYFLRENEIPAGNIELPAKLDDILAVTIIDKPKP
jgi:mono/diheme cytochrome c family protein